MKQLIILVGPPAAGKDSYFANNFVTDSIKINQDEQGKQGHLEKFKYCLEHSDTCNKIVVCRMNFDKEQRQRYIKPAKEAGYHTRIIVLHESRDTCFKRGMHRLINEKHPTIKTEEHLHKAIDFFFSHYERPTLDEADEVEYRYPEQTLKLNAIICDIDGTMANCSHRQHFVRGEKKDWKNFLLPQNVEQDTLNEWCKNITNSLHNRYNIIMCSGRIDTLEKTTRDWLEKYKVFYDHLFMRPRNDHRQDHIIKEIILDFEIKTRYNNIVFTIDDRDSIVKLWRDRGIVCLQCDWGNF